MIVGLGIDLVENSRFEEELARGNWLSRDGIFTTKEIRHCSGGKYPARRYAACFAAKEATLKALGVAVSDLAMFREAEIMFGLGGDCAVVLHHRLKLESKQLGVRHINLSIALSKKETGAMVILDS